MPVGPNTPLSGSVFANALSVTKQAQGLFSDKVAQMKAIGNAIDASRIHLVTNAMISDSGGQWSNAVNAWGDQFTKIVVDTQDMADMLGNTVTLIQQNEGQNSDVVSNLVTQANATVFGSIT